MSEKQNIDDFFAKQKAKKQKNQKGQPKVQEGPSTTSTKKRGNAEENKKEDSQASQQQILQQQQDFIESSDEETPILLDENDAVIKDAKEVEASKRKENEKEQHDLFGWGGLDKKNPSAQMSGEPSKASGINDTDILKSRVAAPKKFGGGEINFSRGPQTFKKSNKMMNQEEFPELGEVESTKKTDASNVSKKDSTSIGNFGSSVASGKTADGAERQGFSQGFKPSERGGEPREERKEAKMPVFTRKIKVTTDASQNVEDIQASKQNYDFSSLKISSAATNKTAAERAKDREENPDGYQDRKPRDEDGERPERVERGERGEGERGGRGRGGRGQAYGGMGGGFEKNERPPYRKTSDASNDSFEEVKEKKRGPPTFARGGKSYGGV